VRTWFALAMLALLPVAAGCGGHSSDAAQRKAVTAYIERVDAVEQQLRYPLLKIERTYQAFSAHPGTLKKYAPQFATAEATLHTLQTRLQLIDPPPDARRLRTLLVGLIGAQAGLAHELTLLVNFLPAYSTALQPLGSADVQLKKSLAAVAVAPPKPVKPAELKAAQAAYRQAVTAAAAGQAAAINTYLLEVAKVLAGLRGLRPPPAMAPAYRTQVATLGRVRATGTALVVALERKQYARVAALDRSFQQAASASTSLAAQRAQIAAVKAYNARVQAVGSLALRVDGERARLQKKLG
jgi:hypothetical protein